MSPSTVFPNSWIELSRGAIQHNLRTLGVMLAPANLTLVVKGHAYGHGDVEVVTAAREAGVADFATFSAQEAARVLPILQDDPGKTSLQIMGHIEREDLPWAFENGVDVWVHDMSRWQAILDLQARGRLQDARLHVELETGMNRTGLDPGPAAEVIRYIHDADDMVLAGICSHLAGAEEIQHEPRIRGQARRFSAFLKQMAEEGIQPLSRHLCSSSAALLYPELRYDQVRIGIAAYGHWPTQQVRGRMETEEHSPWRPMPALAWASRVMSVKAIPEGQLVGYGIGHETLKKSRIAVVPVGYGDGLTRGLSNLGFVLIKGRRCPIVGFVNMNMIHVDVTHVDHVEPGDDVVLIGRQGERSISVSSFAEANAAVNYEMMTRLSLDIPRRLVA